MATRDEISEVVVQVLAERGGVSFTADLRDQIEQHTAQLSGMLADRSLGRIINGPAWIDGASVTNGTITADKLVVNTLEAITISTGSLNVTGTITLAASFPATGAKITLSSSGLLAVNASAVTTNKIGVDGSAFFGSTGGTEASAALSISTAGVVTVKNTLTLGTGGKIIDADGSYWDQNGIVLVASGSAADTVVWNRSGFTPVATIQGFISTDSSGLSLISKPDGSLLSSGGAHVDVSGDDSSGGSASLGAYTAGGNNYALIVDAANTEVKVQGPSVVTTLIDANGDMYVHRRLYPGGTTTRYITDSGSAMVIEGGAFIVNSGTFTAAGAVVLGGASSAVGFFGSGGSAKITGWSVTNGTLSRSYDADTVTVAGLADIVYTLIADLKSYALIG